MALPALGLSLLKLKFPELRDKLSYGFDTSELFREMLGSYAEAVRFRDILIKGNQDPASLNEYDLVCSGLEDDVKYSLMIREHLKALNRRRS
jgi:hypothetical protein